MADQLWLMTRVREEEYDEVLCVSFSCFPGFSLVLSAAGLGGKVGKVCKEFEYNRDEIYWVNVLR